MAVTGKTPEDERVGELTLPLVSHVMIPLPLNTCCLQETWLSLPLTCWSIEESRYNNGAGPGSECCVSVEEPAVPLVCYAVALAEGDIPSPPFGSHHWQWAGELSPMES